MTHPTHDELIVAAKWERYRAAALIHDTEHTSRTWLDRQQAFDEFQSAFLGNEERAA